MPLTEREREIRRRRKRRKERVKGRNLEAIAQGKRAKRKAAKTQSKEEAPAAS